MKYKARKKGVNGMMCVNDAGDMDHVHVNLESVDLKMKPCELFHHVSSLFFFLLATCYPQKQTEVS